VLLVWLARNLPQSAPSSAFTGVMIASVLLLVSAAVFSVWTLVAKD
jgi:hypothetical protein